jgi:hypothetical protein
LKRIQAPALAAAIFALNVYVCWGLFGIEYLAHMGSVEGSFIGLARYVSLHWRDLHWFPLWHLGMPFQNTYPPMLGFVTAGVAAISRMSIPHAFHWTIALFYCFGPVALFALALRLSASQWAAFVAGAVYSVVSFSAF